MSSYHCGGLSGIVAQNSTIENCFSSVSVSGSHVLGGLAGKVDNSRINNCYATGIIKGDHDLVGGLVGEADGGSYIESCAALGPSVEGLHIHTVF
jgi:hypothetical protein